MKILWELDDSLFQRREEVRDLVSQLIAEACPEVETLRVGIQLKDGFRFECALTVEESEGEENFRVFASHEDLRVAIQQTVQRLGRTLTRRDQVSSLIRQLLR